MREPTEAQKHGNEPVHKGSNWTLGGHLVEGKVFVWDTYAIELIDTDGDGVLDKCVKADFDTCGYHVFLFGLYDPILRVTKNQVLAFNSKMDAPALFELDWYKIRKKADLDNVAGRAFVKRLPEILNYTFDAHKEDKE